VKKRTYNKLVRDNIPKIIEAEERKFAARQVPKSGGSPDDEFIGLLFEKLDEEVAELKAVRYEDPIEIAKELADVHEVIEALIESLPMTTHDYNYIRYLKAHEKGVYQHRQVLVWVEVDE